MMIRQSDSHLGQTEQYPSISQVIEVRGRKAQAEDDGEGPCTVRSVRSVRHEPLAKALLTTVEAIAIKAPFAYRLSGYLITFKELQKRATLR